MDSRFVWWTPHGVQIFLVDFTWLHMDYKSPGGIHLDASGTPDDLTNGVHMLHMDSMWTPEISGFYGSDSRWTPDGLQIKSMWSPHSLQVKVWLSVKCTPDGNLFEGLSYVYHIV